MFILSNSANGQMALFMLQLHYMALKHQRISALRRSGYRAARPVRSFHNPAKEPTFGHAIVPPVNDSVQLSVEAYRSRLYDFIAQKKGHARTGRTLPSRERPPAPAATRPTHLE